MLAGKASMRYVGGVVSKDTTGEGRGPLLAPLLECRGEEGLVLPLRPLLEGSTVGEKVGASIRMVGTWSGAGDGPTLGDTTGYVDSQRSTVRFTDEHL
jgi:hypothetical protein